jgi:hypothetical protein
MLFGQRLVAFRPQLMPFRLNFRTRAKKVNSVPRRQVSREARNLRTWLATHTSCLSFSFCVATWTRITKPGSKSAALIHVCDWHIRFQRMASCSLSARLFLVLAFLMLMLQALTQRGR